MSTVLIGAGLVLLGALFIVGRRAISYWNARTSERIAVPDRDPNQHRPDRDVAWVAAGGVLLVLVGVVMVVLGLTSR